MNINYRWCYKKSVDEEFLFYIYGLSKSPNYKYIITDSLLCCEYE